MEWQKGLALRESLGREEQYGNVWDEGTGKHPMKRIPPPEIRLRSTVGGGRWEIGGPASVVTRI